MQNRTLDNTCVLSSLGFWVGVLKFQQTPQTRKTGIIGTPAVREFTHNGNTYTEYLLNKRDSREIAELVGSSTVCLTRGFCDQVVKVATRTLVAADLAFWYNPRIPWSG